MSLKRSSIATRILAALTLLSFTFTQALPAWAEPMLGRQVLRPEMDRAGLEETLSGQASFSATATSPNLSLGRGLWVPFGGISTGPSGSFDDPIPGVPGAEFIVEGVYANDGGQAGAVAKVFRSPLVIDGDTVAQVLGIVQRGRTDPGRLSPVEAVIFQQVKSLVETEPPARIVTRLEKEVRQKREANAAIAVAALREKGYFCGHFSYPGTLHPIRTPIRGITELGVGDLEPLLALVEQNKLERFLQQQNIFVAEEGDLLEEKDANGQVQAIKVRLRPVREGRMEAPGDWISLTNDEQLSLYGAYKQSKVAMEQFQGELEGRKERKPGERRKLEAHRQLVNQAKRKLFEQVTQHIHGSAATFRNYFLEDYLGGEERLKGYFEIAWGFKRFDQFLRVVKDVPLQNALAGFAAKLNERVAGEERMVDGLRSEKRFRSAEDLSAMRLRLRRLKDIAWTVEKEVLGLVQEIQWYVRDPGTLEGLTPDQVAQLPESTIQELYSLALTFRSMNRRMETRGRDSLGLLASFTFENKGAFDDFRSNILTAQEQTEFGQRLKTEDFVNEAIEIRFGAKSDGTGDPTKPVSVTFVYKTALLVGRLGDNVATLTRFITKDKILQRIIRQKNSIKLIHTRWASAGVISPENCHAVGNKGIYTVQVDGATEMKEIIMEIASDRIAPRYGRNGNIFAVLNGDIDNYDRSILVGTQFFPNLKKEYESRSFSPDDVRRAISENIKTDTKVIPLTIEGFIPRGMTLEEAVRHAIRSFSGSFSIQVMSDLEPDKVIVARGGDGQGLYIGISDDGFIPASEQLGFVDSTQRFIKVEPIKVKEGETERLVPVYAVLDRNFSPTLENLFLYRADTGERLGVTEDDVETTESTTRDVDLGANRNFFIKEVFEAPEMFETTIEGRISVDESGKVVQVTLDEEQLPQIIREGLRSKEGAESTIRKIFVTGMGTANAAGLVGAQVIERYLRETGFTGEVKGIVATELGKFHITGDMSDTLIIAVSQSGATKDTNSVLDTAVGKKAKVIAVTNRRDSDIVFIARKSQGGIFYTGTGRETEIAVASTKAYYAQIGALFLLGMGMAQAMGLSKSNRMLVGDAKELVDTPGKMVEFLGGVPKDTTGGALVHPLVKAARYWPLRKGEKAIVGDGMAYETAEEARIKNSELTYMAIGRDYVTHPKHINLSAEPWLLVLAANIKGHDNGWFRSYLLQELNKYLAHKAAPILIATKQEADTHLRRDGTPRFSIKWTAPNGEERSRLVDIIEVPEAPEHFSPIYSAMASHLLAYHTALAIHELSEMIGKGRSLVSEEWEERSGQGKLGSEIVGDSSFHAVVRGAFEPFWEQLGDGVILPGIRPGLLKRFIDTTHVLEGNGHFDSQVNYGGKNVPFMEAFNAYAERIRLELTRGIDAIRHQAKYVTVGVETAGKVVSDELEGLVKELYEKERFSPEMVGSALGLYLAYKRDGRPQFQVLEHPFEKTRSQLVVVMTDQGGIGEAVTDALKDKGVSLVGSAIAVEFQNVEVGSGSSAPGVPGVSVTKDAIVQVYTLDKPLSELEGEAAGLEESLSSLIQRKLYGVELGVVGEIGNWLVTKTGALIGKPGIPRVGVQLANIDPSAVLEPGVRLVGEKTVVEAGARVGRGTYVENAKIREKAVVGAGSVLITREEAKDRWVLSPNLSIVAEGKDTEIGKEAQVGEGTYLLNFKVGAGAVWTRYQTYPNIGINGELGERVQATTAKIVLGKIAPGSVVGNFEGDFEGGKVTGPIEVTDFVGRPGERIGQAGRSGHHYVEYVEGFSLPPMVVKDPGRWLEDRQYRELNFMSTRVIRGDRSIALEFSGTLEPTELTIDKITGKERSGHGILAFGFGGVMGGGSKLIGVPDRWNRDPLKKPGDVLDRFDRTYLGHFAALAPRGFSFQTADKRQQTATGEGWGRLGNFSLRGDLTARVEVPAWTLDYAVDVVLTQMEEEFEALRVSGAWGDIVEVQNPFNSFIQDAIESEILELKAERDRLSNEERSLPEGHRKDDIRQRSLIVNEGILRLETHRDSGAWRGQWRIRPEDGQPAFGSWWREDGRWVNHDGTYRGFPNQQHTIEQLAASQPEYEHPVQRWDPPMTQEDWQRILALFKERTLGYLKGNVSGLVHPSARVESGAVVEEGAILGPGVVVGEGAKIRAGANLGYVEVGREAEIQERSRLYGVIIAPRAVVGKDSWLRLSMVGSEGEASPSQVGEGTEMSLSKVMDGSSVGKKNTIVGSMVVQGSKLGDGNEVSYGRLEAVKAGNQNKMNSLMQHVQWGNNGRSDHPASFLWWEEVEPISIRVPGTGRSAEIHAVVTHGAYTAIQGQRDKPVRVAGSFLDGQTVLEAGASVRRSFAKVRVGEGESLFFDFSSGPGREKREPAGVLERNGPSFIFRFLLSYSLGGLREKSDRTRDAWAVGLLVEETAIRTIEGLRGLLSQVGSLDSETDLAIQELTSLIENMDFIELRLSRSSSQVANLRSQQSKAALQAIRQAILDEESTPSRSRRPPEAYSRLQLLQGLRRAVEALDGRYRLRYDPASDALRFTEGKWGYDPKTGEYTWQPLPLPTVPEEAPPGEVSVPDDFLEVDLRLTLFKHLGEEILGELFGMAWAVRASKGPLVRLYPYQDSSNRTMIVTADWDRPGLSGAVGKAIGGKGFNIQLELGDSYPQTPRPVQRVVAFLFREVYGAKSVLEDSGVTGEIYRAVQAVPLVSVNLEDFKGAFSEMEAAEALTPNEVALLFQHYEELMGRPEPVTSIVAMEDLFPLEPETKLVVIGVVPTPEKEGALGRLTGQVFQAHGSLLMGKALSTDYSDPSVFGGTKVKFILQKVQGGKDSESVKQLRTALAEALGKPELSQAGLEEMELPGKLPSVTATEVGPPISTVTELKATLTSVSTVPVPAGVGGQRVLIVTPDGLPKLSVASLFVPPAGEPPLIIEVLANDGAHKQRVEAGLEELGLSYVQVHDVKAEFDGNVGEAITTLQMRHWQAGRETLVVTALSGLEEVARFLGIPEAESMIRGIKALVDRSQSIWM